MWVVNDSEAPRAPLADLNRVKSIEYFGLAGVD